LFQRNTSFWARQRHEASCLRKQANTLPKGHPNLENEAFRLIRAWQFDPATCEGKPVVDSGIFTIHFPPQ
jgi:hypothetical protein